jgi:hypothetical protein
MTWRFARVAVVVLLAGLAASCKSAPAYNVEQQPFATASASLEQRAEQIRRAGVSAGWMMSEVAPGQMRGKYNFKGKATLIVLVSYTPTAFSIKLDPTTTSYDDGNVKKRFNNYVRSLEQAIYQQSAMTASM